MADQQTLARTTQRRSTLLPYALLVLCMFFWSSNWIVGRFLHETTPPITINFWRWTVAAVLLLPFSWMQTRQSWPIIRREWKLMLVFGITGAGAFHSLIYTGLRHTDAINALLLNSAIPVIIIIISWLWYRETITWRQTIGIVVSFLGVFTIVARGDPAMLLHLQVNYGDALIFIALPIWGVYSVMLRQRPAGIGDLAFLQAISVVAVLSTLPFYAVEIVQGGRMSFDVTTVSCILYVAVSASLLGYIFWNFAVVRVGANAAGFTSHLMPAFGAAMAIFLLGERAYLYHAIGIALILSGVFLSTLRRTAG